MSDKFNDLLLKIQNDYADKETRESAVEEHYRETGIPLYDDIEDFAENLARDLNDDLVDELDNEQMEKLYLCIKSLFHEEIEESENG